MKKVNKIAAKNHYKLDLFQSNQKFQYKKVSTGWQMNFSMFWLLKYWLRSLNVTLMHQQMTFVRFSSNKIFELYVSRALSIPIASIQLRCCDRHILQRKHIFFLVKILVVWSLTDILLISMICERETKQMMRARLTCRVPGKYIIHCWKFRVRVKTLRRGFWFNQTWLFPSR